MVCCSVCALCERGGTGAGRPHRPTSLSLAHPPNKHTHTQPETNTMQDAVAVRLLLGGSALFRDRLVEAVDYAEWWECR